MIRIIAGRLIALPMMLFGVVLVLFVLTRIVPSDPARVAVGPNANQAAVETMRERMGLNDPLPIQFVRYLGQLVQGDLGNSVYDNRPVTASIRTFAPATLELALVATLLTVTFGILFGVYAAAANGRVSERLLRFFAIVGRAMPAFWLALLLQFVFYGRLKWLPSGGRIDLNSMDPPTSITHLYLVDSILTLNWPAFKSSFSHILLPAIALAAAGIADIMRMTRSQMLLEMRRDYARTARAKGLEGRNVLRRHVLPTALNPVLTVIGIRTGYLLAGTVLIETIFRWPGLGRYSLQAIGNFDFPAITGVTIFVTLMFVLINLVVDLIQAYIDPRVRHA